MYIQGETCAVLLPHASGPTHFCTTAVNRSIKYDGTETTVRKEQPIPPPQANTLVKNTLVENFSLARALTMTIPSKGQVVTYAQDMEDLVALATKLIPKSKYHTKYADSRKKEVDLLINHGAFIPASKTDACGHQIYGSRFLYYVKNDGPPNALEKSLFV